jgi:anthranilate phosphoribosyltransferase
MIKEAIAKVTTAKDLDEKEMAEVMEEIMAGEASPAQIAAFIVALRMKGETVEEITGAAKTMRRVSTKIPGEVGEEGEVVIDTCGTGGDGAMTFNVSTAAAFVVAGGGVKVAKHGNRSVSSLCGSADVLEELGLSVDVSPEQVARQFHEAGIGFLFAPVFHRSMRHAATPRKDVGVRTIFNVLGPLTNPAGTRHQLLGVYRKELCPLLARVLLRLGTERAMVVHGMDGVDEISVTAGTEVSEVRDGKVREYRLDPGDFGLPHFETGELVGGGRQENARILKNLLSGEENGARKAMVAVNAGAAFYVAGKCRDLAEGIEYAHHVLASGEGLRKLEKLIEVTPA